MIKATWKWTRYRAAIEWGEMTLVEFCEWRRKWRV